MTEERAETTSASGAALCGLFRHLFLHSHCGLGAGFHELQAGHPPVGDAGSVRGTLGKVGATFVLINYDNMEIIRMFSHMESEAWLGKM